MKLSLIDRIILTNILPAEGNYETLICVSDIRKKVILTQEELEKYKVKSTDDGQIMVPQNDAEFEYKFTELEKTVINIAFQKLNEREKLTEVMLPLYKNFKNEKV